MTEAARLVEDLAAQGVQLGVNGDSLEWTAARGRLTSDLLERMRRHKPELLALLRSQATPAPTEADIALVRDALGDDWAEVSRSPVHIGAWAEAIRKRLMRERGEVPLDYTAITICAGCGAVPIFEGAGAKVVACPWCFNRHAGLPMPPAANLPADPRNTV